MAVQLRVAAYGAAALDALRQVVAEAKRADPMAPVTVIAPNNVAGIVARRHLAVGTDGRPGIAGIEVTTLTRLAERIAAPLLAPRRPATRTVLAATWRRALAEDPRCFRNIADHPATVRALVQAHADLRDVSDVARDAMKTATPVVYDLVELHTTVTDRLRAAWYEPTDLLLIAAEQLPPLGSCVLYAPQDLSRAEIKLVTAMTSGALTVIAALTGVQRADAGVHRTLQRLGLTTDARPQIATASRVLNASDSDDEVRCVVRDLMTTLQTTPAHRVAVLYGAAVPYARLLHEQLGAADVTINGAGVRAVDERAVARTLRDVLALAGDDVPRADLFRALANAPTRDFTGERIPISRWERISRAAGVVGGEDWTSRLDLYISDLRAEAATAAADEERVWLAERHNRDADTAAALQTFASGLRNELNDAVRMSSWHDLATWALSLSENLIGPPDELTKLPAEEQYAASTVVSLLRALDGLDAIEAAASFDAMCDLLDVELAASLPRMGRFGDGVLVAPLSSAIGLDVDVVYVVGLSEDLFPGRQRADALLPDRARLATAGELPAQRERLDAKYRHLLAAFAAAKESVASFPRGDLRRSSQRLPSRFLLPSLRELSGDHALPATAWAKPGTYGGAMTTAGSFAGELLHTERVGTEQEWRVRQAAVGRLDDDIVGDAVALIRARATSDFTRYDGNLAGVDGLPDYVVDEQAVSPTALEGYASCPHGYFVERLLRVRQLEQPEEVVTISPLDIGTLIHESLDELITEFADDLPAGGAPWTAQQRARLLEIATAKAEQFRERGLTGHPRLWAGERRRIMRDVEWLLEDDDRWRAERGALVLTSELPFGMAGAPAVEIALDGGRIRMRGSADKVDRAADGTIIVTDIKTGSASSFKEITQDDPTAGGSKLQLPVYAYAARERFGNASTPVEAAYWFVRKSRGKRIVVDLKPEVEQAYVHALSVLVRSIAAGLFPARSPDGPDFAYVQCEYCNPDGIGYGDGRDRWERKRLDPALREYVALVEPEVVAGEDA